MSHEAKRQYVNKVRDRYRKANRTQKSAILSELCAVCELTRKYAISLLNRDYLEKTKRPGPRPKYGLSLVKHLKHLWMSMGQICSKRMAAAMPQWLPFYEVDQNIKELLLQISPATIDRLLSAVKCRKGKSATNPALYFKSRIPILAKDWNVTAAGYVQADTVAHCGDRLEGAFANSLTVTDLYSCWTENRALWTKGTTQVISAMADIEKSLPFKLIRFKSDSGTEFLNHQLLQYFRERSSEPVEFVRSRPYKKDDNCYVEQKNFTHVRELFGYERIETAHLVPLMNKIYKEIWNPLQNYFLPAMKIERKMRIGARIKKEYGKPKTPYQRIMESADTMVEVKAELKQSYSEMNPFMLQNSLEKHLKMFFEELRRNQNPDRMAA